jgi:hypothetical protein
MFDMVCHCTSPALGAAQNNLVFLWAKGAPCGAKIKASFLGCISRKS